jgi:replicative DNA helicase
MNIVTPTFEVEVATEEQINYIEAQSMRSLSETSFEKWGDPIENRKKLVPYGYAPLDRAIWGIAPKEFIIIQGAEKGRKTTFLLNILTNIFKRDKLIQKPVICYDTLESSSGPEQIKDGFLCMLASAYIMKQGHSSYGRCDACGKDVCTELMLSPRSLLFIERSPLQEKALEIAINFVSDWTIYLFGPGTDEGNTRNLEASMRRWLWLKRHRNVNMFVVDHIQQYYFGRTLTDYEKQQAVVPPLSAFVGQNKTTLIALSQLSLTTRKDGKDGGRMYATGGAQAAAEANTVIQTLASDENATCLGVRVVESRYSGSFTFYTKIDPVSGITYGDTSNTMIDPAFTERPMTAAEEEEAPWQTPK